MNVNVCYTLHNVCYTMCASQCTLIPNITREEFIRIVRQLIVESNNNNSKYNEQ